MIGNAGKNTNLKSVTLLKIKCIYMVPDKLDILDLQVMPNRICLFHVLFSHIDTDYFIGTPLRRQKRKSSTIAAKIKHPLVNDLDVAQQPPHIGGGAGRQKALSVGGLHARQHGVGIFSLCAHGLRIVPSFHSQENRKVV